MFNLARVVLQKQRFNIESEKITCPLNLSTMPRDPRAEAQGGNSGDNLINDPYRDTLWMLRGCKVLSS